jgi:ParB family chromosome partitioning protein
LGDETIAARLRTTATVVKQRRRLASVSEKLLDVYAEDGMALEQLMAFTVTDDHARQEQVWQSVSDGVYNSAPYTIRSLLTEDAIEASDKRAQFVGIEAYETAGGLVMLDRLVTEKLKASAELVSAEGWKWIAVAVSFPYGHSAGMRRLTGQMCELDDAEHASREALRSELERLEQEYAQADELPNEVDQRLGEIETALAAFEERSMIYDPAEIARAGVFISLDNGGTLRIERGFVRQEDEAPTGVTQQDGAANEDEDVSSPAGDTPTRTVITIGAVPSEDGDQEEDDGIKPLPDRLVSELTAHRTLALQDALACNPHVAMTALLHKLCLDSFFHNTSGTCLEAFVRHVYPPVQAPDLKESASARAIADRQDAWKAELPENETALWDWLANLADDRRMALLAHCVSLGVNALHERADRPGGGGNSAYAVERRLAQADHLARVVGLDMLDAGWRPTVDNYLGRVTKPRILEAVREAKGEQSAQLIDHLKKGEMAKEAERLLDGTGWLPEPLRLAEPANADIEEAADAEALPAFLEGNAEMAAAE